MNEVLDRHEKIALQFSGGRDSLACLYLMRSCWDRITVYWCNTGSPYPETVSLIEQIKNLVPHFVEVWGNQLHSVENFGLPTDLLPVSSTPMGLYATNKGLLMQDRYSCCIRSLMLPMHERMIQDGITMVIRGQKNADQLKSGIRSGYTENGIEYFFPIEEWSARQVMEFLKKEGAPIPRFYEMMNSAPDCLNCTAYWEEGSMQYLKRYHHGQYLKNQGNLEKIRVSVMGHIEAFNRESGL